MGKYLDFEIKAFMVLVNKKGEYLLLKNNHADSIIVGYVNPPAGHLEVGETITEAAKREAFEEMGIKNLEEVEIKGTINVHGFKEKEILMFVVKALVPDSETPTDHGVGLPVWVQSSKIKEYKILEDVEKILNLVEKTPKGEVFQVTSEFKDKKLISFKVG
jgi:ADP-ribose pyrophosphatase YjhB (NUDIX family)